MQRLRTTKNKISPLWLVLVLLFTALAHAEPSSPTVSNSRTCAVLEDFSGHVEVLNEDRTKLIDPDLKSAIQCGSWMSVDVGWARLKHRDGHRIQVGPSAFVQFPENNMDGKFSGDHVVVFRGEVYGETGSGASPLKIMTTNARLKISVGSGIALYNDKEEETQFLVLENKGEFENRFAPEKKIIVKAGEASTLNFRLLRVVPSAPRAISVSHLRPILADLHLTQREQEYAVKTVYKRLNRQLSSVFKPSPDDAGYAEVERDLATIDKIKKEKPKHTYLRHRPSKKDAELRHHWMSKVVGDDPQTESLVAVDGAVKNRKPSSISGEQKDKQTIMEELAHLKADE